jgi:hypothetical protein
MKKKTYEKPMVRVVELRHRTHILTGSNYDVNDQLQNEETEYGW